MQGKLVELLPLTYAVLEDEPVSKKEKPPSNFAFAISDVNNKKFRTSFCAETEQELKAWKKHLSESINLGTNTAPSLFPVERFCFVRFLESEE